MFRPQDPAQDSSKNTDLRQRNQNSSLLHDSESQGHFSPVNRPLTPSGIIIPSERSSLIDVSQDKNYGSIQETARRRSDCLSISTSTQTVNDSDEESNCGKANRMLSKISCCPLSLGCCQGTRSHNYGQQVEGSQPAGQEGQGSVTEDSSLISLCTTLGNILSQSNIPWLVYFLFLAIIFFMLIWTSEKSPTNLKKSYIQLILIMFMILALLGEIYCLGRKKDRSWVRFRNFHSDHSHGYLLAGVYVFGTGSMFMIIQFLLSCPHATIVSDCFSPNYTSSGSSISSFKTPESPVCTLDIIHDVVRLTFTATQILFLQSFAKATFCQSAFVKWVLFHAMTTNICVWIRYVILETGIFRDSSQSTQIIIHYGIPSHEPDEVLAEAKEISELLTPFTLEYSLIVAGISYAISSHMKKFPTDEPRDDEAPAGLMGSDLTRIPSRFRELAPHGSQPGLLPGLLLGITLLTAAITLKDHNDLHRHRCLQFFFSFQCLLYASQIYALLRIALALQKHRTDHYRSLRPDDVLLLTGFAGLIALSLPLCYAAIEYTKQNPHSSTTMACVISATVIMVIETLLQVLVILFSQRYNYCSHDAVAVKSAKTIGQCSLFLLTTNLSIWALDSFIEVKNAGKSSYPFAQMIMGDQWLSIVAVTYPFCIFFQFHSAAMLFELWAKYKFPTRYHSEHESVVFVV